MHTRTNARQSQPKWDLPKEIGLDSQSKCPNRIHILDERTYQLNLMRFNRLSLMLPVKHTIFFFIDFFHINFPSRFLYMRQAIRVFPFAADANSMAVSIYCSIEWVVSLSQQWLNGCACVCVCVFLSLLYLRRLLPLSLFVFSVTGRNAVSKFPLKPCLHRHRWTISIVSTVAIFENVSMRQMDGFLQSFCWNEMALFLREFYIAALISSTLSRKDFKFRSRLISNFEQNRTSECVNVNPTLTWKKLNHFFRILK